MKNLKNLLRLFKSERTQQPAQAQEPKRVKVVSRLCLTIDGFEDCVLEQGDTVVDMPEGATTLREAMKELNKNIDGVIVNNIFDVAYICYEKGPGWANYVDEVYSLV